MIFVIDHDQAGHRLSRHFYDKHRSVGWFDFTPLRTGANNPSRSLGLPPLSRNMSSSSGSPESWISSFCSLLGHEYFAEISEDFIEDDFNLTGLQTQVAMYKEALEVSSSKFEHPDLANIPFR